MASTTAVAQPQGEAAEGLPRRPLDLHHLAQQTLGDPGLKAEVLRLYDEMQRTYLARIESSTNRNDMMVNLHALKGAANGVGAFALGVLAKAAEDDLKAGLPANSERIADIAMAVEEASAFIATMLEEPPDGSA